PHLPHLGGAIDHHSRLPLRRATRSPSGYSTSQPGRLGTVHPTLPELLSTARVVALPLTQRFRGINTREAWLLHGPQGWTEFSPFIEYDDAEAALWLAAALDFGWNETPLPLRTSIK